MVLCLTLLRVILDVWELRKVRLYGDNPSVQQSQYQIAPGELRGVAGGGELCLEGETDTGIGVCSSSVCSSTVCSSGVCLCTVCSLSSGSAHSYGCVVNGPSAMVASYYGRVNMYPHSITQIEER